jgi:asparagine synthase (glutamine-hydrolysing)
MCGITGIISSNPQLVSDQRIRAGTACLSHRGNDDEGIYVKQHLAFGHKRLSIIDLSRKASQPFFYHDRYVLVYNGEIYNYRELKEELLAKGFAFTTQSDTEVVAAAFAAYGKNCLQHFDGMFAFAIWDQKEEKLFAARDRMGEKPFFYYFDGEQFLFASEMKALWKMGIRKEVNLSMLYNFISIGYTGNPSDPQETFYQNIHKLPASGLLNYCFHKKELSVEKYWQVFPEVDHNISEAEATEKFIHLLSDSVQKRTRSDVAVGTSLSGGLDSSTIVALCNELAGPSYAHKCFTAAFPGFEKDETKYARQVAEQFNLEHHLSEIKPGELVSLMERMMYFQEEPVSSSSPLAQFKVFEAAKANGVTVLLDGQGADEILAGYTKYFGWYWQELFRNKKLQTSGELKAARSLGIEHPFGYKHKLAALFPELVSAIWQGKKSRTAHSHPDLNREFAFSHKRDLYYSLPSSPDLNGALYFNSFVYGLEELLRLADRNSMAHSVEVRLPFLQHKLVEFMFTLPPGFKIKNGWSKWLLRSSIENKLPAEIVWRKDKTGFEPPQKIWMQDEKLQSSIMEAKNLLVDEKILAPSVLKKKIQPHDTHVADGRDWKYWSASFLFQD